MRGDRPELLSHISCTMMFTPHARGSTLLSQRAPSLKAVYPACAGIDLVKSCSRMVSPSLPRMRGDRPLSSTCDIDDPKFTPHARGSTGVKRVIFGVERVYPACAGIDLDSYPSSHLPFGLPRMRGDRPEDGSLSRDGMEFTPHARGSTLERGG